MKTRWFNVVVLVVTVGAISVFSARRIEAQFSSPVKIVNTTSAPAITSRMDDAGRVPYQSAFNGITACGGHNFCLNTFPPVPAGHRLVLTQISGAHDISVPGPIADSVRIALLSSSGVLTQFNWDLQNSGSWVLPVTAYLDPGVSVSLAENITGANFDVSPQWITLTGYMLDCTAAPCSAIAQ